MEQINQKKKVDFSRKLLLNFHFELRHLKLSNTHNHVKIVDKYLPKFITCRNHLKELLEMSFSSIRYSIESYLQHILDCLEALLDILFDIPIIETDKQFFYNHLHRVQACLNSHGIIMPGIPMYIN
jgi:hypothetical protein